jgi:hypothetical protein
MRCGLRDSAEAARPLCSRAVPYIAESLAARRDSVTAVSEERGIVATVRLAH